MQLEISTLFRARGRRQENSSEVSQHMLLIVDQATILQGVHLITTPALDLGVIDLYVAYCKCGIVSELVNHFYLFCPRYAAQVRKYWEVTFFKIQAEIAEIK